MTTVTTTKARQQVSFLLEEAQRAPIYITRRGQTVSVLFVPDEYARLRRLETWADAVQISRSLRGVDASASALLCASHKKSYLNGHREQRIFPLFASHA
jgi:PHD/YefM family antitoxin component YafN of YafNO toxin-antitoxin module